MKALIVNCSPVKTGATAEIYWANIPGQFKAFIDRCTPWCNTHEPHATIAAGKKL